MELISQREPSKSNSWQTPQPRLSTDQHPRTSIPILTPRPEDVSTQNEMKTTQKECRLSGRHSIPPALNQPFAFLRLKFFVTAAKSTLMCQTKAHILDHQGYVFAFINSLTSRDQHARRYLCCQKIHYVASPPEHTLKTTSGTCTLRKLKKRVGIGRPGQKSSSQISLLPD